MSLPTKKTARRLNISDQTIFVYGPPKIGKTTFCSGANEALFLATEPGTKGLEVYEQQIRSWPDFLTACKEIAAGNHQFRTIVVDTIDNLYKFCVDFVCKKHGFEHQADFDYGKGYDLISGSFHRVLTSLCQLPYGVMMVSHAQDKEIETAVGKITKTVPTLPERARKIVLGVADMILFYDIGAKIVDEKRIPTRVIRAKPSDRFEAGDRTKCLPPTIDLGDDPAQSYARFLQAYVKGGGSCGTDVTGPSVPSTIFDDETDVPADGASPTGSPAATPTTSTNIPADSKAPPLPSDVTQSTQTAQPAAERIRAAIRSATTTSELSIVVADAKQALSRGDQEMLRPELNARKRELAMGPSTTVPPSTAAADSLAGAAEAAQ